MRGPTRAGPHDSRTRTLVGLPTFTGSPSRDLFREKIPHEIAQSEHLFLRVPLCLRHQVGGVLDIREQKRIPLTAISPVRNMRA